jgi:hypothetical protein
MRIAVVFSAQVRTALLAAPSIKKFIGDLWPHCDFFCHTWLKDTDKLFEHGMYVLSNKITVDQTTVDELHNIYKFKKFKMENWEDVVLQRPFDPPLFYSWIESLKLKHEYEQENNFKYDYVVKLRLDNIYSDNISLQKFIDQSEPNSLAANNVMANGSVDDFLFVSDSTVTDKLINWYPDWITKTKSYFAQLEMPDFLREQNIKLINLGIDTGLPIGLPSEIGIYRLICTNFDPITQYGKCVECDKILYWDGPKEPKDLYYLTREEAVDLARRVKAKYNKLPNVLKHFENEI